MTYGTVLIDHHVCALYYVCKVAYRKGESFGKSPFKCSERKRKCVRLKHGGRGGQRWRFILVTMLTVCFHRICYALVIKIGACELFSPDVGPFWPQSKTWRQPVEWGSVLFAKLDIITRCKNVRMLIGGLSFETNCIYCRRREKLYKNTCEICVVSFQLCLPGHEIHLCSSPSLSLSLTNGTPRSQRGSKPLFRPEIDSLAIIRLFDVGKCALVPVYARNT